MAIALASSGVSAGALPKPEPEAEPSSVNVSPAMISSDDKPFSALSAATVVSKWLAISIRS
jgi:hypothetical protein